MKRRDFLKGMLLAGAAPAIVRADSLMRVVPTNTVVDGFGLAPLKREGATVFYDDAALGRLLYPGTNAYWGTKYKDFPEEWDKLFETRAEALARKIRETKEGIKTNVPLHLNWSH